MKQFNGFDEASKKAEFTGSAKLPAGGYVCKIKGVRYEEHEEWSDTITLQLDVIEGEYKDFFKNKYENDTNEDKKWKGTARIYVPSDDGSEKDEWTKTAFARWTNAIEKSNKGYTWDWDETKWKGKTVGVIFREIGTVIEGKEIVYTEASSADSVENIRNGKFYQPGFKAKNGYTGKKNTETALNSDTFVNVPEGVEEEVPF